MPLKQDEVLDFLPSLSRDMQIDFWNVDELFYGDYNLKPCQIALVGSIGYNRHGPDRDCLCVGCAVESDGSHSLNPK